MPIPTVPTTRTVVTAREENLARTYAAALARGADRATARREALAANGITPNPIPRADTATRSEWHAHADRPAPTPAPRHVARHASTAAPVTGGRAVRDMLRVLGACADLDAATAERLAIGTRGRGVATLRAVCAECRVADACAAYAVACEADPAYAVGFYGGRSASERHADPALATVPAPVAAADDDDDERESPWVAVAGSVAAAIALRDAVRLAAAHAAHAERVFA